MNNKLVCIAGMPGAGKSVVSDYLVSKGFQFVRFGQIVLDEVKKRKLKPNEKNEREIREEFRKKYGMGAMALLNLDNFRSKMKKGNVVGDGLYSFEEYQILKKEFGEQFIEIAVYAPPSLRYQRISKRIMPKSDTDLRNRPFTVDEAEKRDVAELINLNKGATIAMADYTILNTKDLKYLKKQTEEILEVILKS